MKLSLYFPSLRILTGADRIPVLTLGFDSESQPSEFVWVNQGKPHLEQRQLPVWVQRHFRSTMAFWVVFSWDRWKMSVW